MPKLAIFIIILMLIEIFPVYAAGTGTAETWDAMIDGITRYSSDRKLREQFDLLLGENDTALINGRVDTGGGLYMLMDVPVYKEPGKSKTTELAHETVVVVTGASQELEGNTWKEIKFLFISEYSKAAVSIDKAWIDQSYLKNNS